MRSLIKPPVALKTVKTLENQYSYLVELFCGRPPGPGPFRPFRFKYIVIVFFSMITPLLAPAPCCSSTE